MLKNPSPFAKNWLAFELNILRRLEFKSISIPFTFNAQLGRTLKYWNVRVNSNDLLRSAHADAVALIENNGEVLSDDALETVLEDAYVPQYKLQNPSLSSWFNETDSWWFDNIRTNIEKLPSPMEKAIALSIGMKVGDYALSFSPETLQMRQPLSSVYKRLRGIQKNPVNNGQNNSCENKNASEFTAENYSDLLYLKLPPASKRVLKESLGWKAWREEWIRGNGGFWNELEAAQRGRLGAHVETKSQYLNLIVDLFKTAQHIDLWAIEHVEDGFIQTQDVVEAVSQVRRVDTIYSKDFSELMGTKAVIITA